MRDLIDPGRYRATDVDDITATPRHFAFARTGSGLNQNLAGRRRSKCLAGASVGEPHDIATGAAMTSVAGLHRDVLASPQPGKCLARSHDASAGGRFCSVHTGIAGLQGRGTEPSEETRGNDRATPARRGTGHAARCNLAIAAVPGDHRSVPGDAQARGTDITAASPGSILSFAVSTGSGLQDSRDIGSRDGAIACQLHQIEGAADAAFSGHGCAAARAGHRLDIQIVSTPQINIGKRTAGTTAAGSIAANSAADVDVAFQRNAQAKIAVKIPDVDMAHPAAFASESIQTLAAISGHSDIDQKRLIIAVVRRDIAHFAARSAS